MAVVAVAICVYWTNTSNKLIDSIAVIAIGFLVYGQVMIIGVHALDLARKNAAGTSAGLTGFFGYFFGTSLLANIAMGRVVHLLGWNAGFIMLLTSCGIAILLMLMTHSAEKNKLKS